MNTKKFIPLRVKMMEHDSNQAQLAAICGVSRGTMCDRFRGLQPWTSVEMDKIGAFLGISREEYGTYFFDGPRFGNPRA